MFVVDDDVRIADLNGVASAMSGQEKDTVLKRRGGEVLHRLHSADVEEVCGRGPACQHCVIRNAVTACLDGKSVSRARMKMEFLPVTAQNAMERLVTASPMTSGGDTLALVIIEDITEMSKLKDIIPMCMQCRKIRNDDEYWQTVE